MSHQAVFLGRRDGSRRPLSGAALKLVICGLLIAGAVAYLIATAMSSTMVYYVTVPELRAGTGAAAREQVRLAGFVVASSVERQGNRLHFAVADVASDEQIPVAYQGVIPDIFGDGIEVVVEGRYARERGVFEARTLLAKCPSKFETASPAETSSAPRA